MLSSPPPSGSMLRPYKFLTAKRSRILRWLGCPFRLQRTDGEINSSLEKEAELAFE
jgi:hypothetical protein